MEEVTTIGLDLAKRVFQVHGADAKGRPVLQKRLRREDVLSFFAKLPPCIVGMEACASSHYWAREIRNLGHDARMIPASYVKPYVARQKNDAADAAAICEAVTRPAVRAAPIKTLAQQAARVVHRTHEILSRQRVSLINAIRSHMAEFGVIAAAGPQHVGSLVERISNSTTPLPDMVRAALSILADQLIALAKQINELEAQMRKHCRKEPEAARLLTIPGIGPITTSAILAGVPDIRGFKSGRDFAAWLGLVPRQNSSGGKERLGRITKMGDRTIRRLLVIGAMSTIRWSRSKENFAESWLGRIIARKPVKLAAVALANKMARIIWAVMTRQETYRAA
ncbi:MAG TPA: IS110 family transposase [Bosea sp. (in: a-proteobacteria)]|jgi:transposase|nr:IS110 family transposase [Bosea sp. (in: a-proteobacteria)]